MPPSEFIPVAEATGLVVPLGAWVLREALAQLGRWQQEHPETAPCQISVNVAAAQLSSGGLAGTVFDALDETGMPPSSLCLEVTESSLMVDPQTAKYTLDRLAASGVRVALDDFGTGYSSLSFLQRFPVHEVKIDRSFVDGLGSSPEDGVLVGAVIALAAALGKSTVAEGVETELQRSEVERLGGTLMQGYLFARPLPADEFEALLSMEAIRPGGPRP
jgi:EAL domain-containing protein (putative c-di-GMP-specific phosphodiesterase class I)